MSDDYETHELELAFQAGAASRDAEIQRLQMALADAEALEIGTAEKCDQFRAELVKALAACKQKDEALKWLMDWQVKHVDVWHNPAFDNSEEALTTQPDDSALKAWVSQRIASTFRKKK